MPKKSIFDSGTVKGSAPRPGNQKKYEENYDKIFRKKKKTEKENVDVEKKDSNS
tara:strand:- start:1078 stop:1239 length:162 start_codon:yes stop_codon:yes gene_type:complete